MASDAPTNLDECVAAHAELTGTPPEVVSSLMLSDALSALQGSRTNHGSRWLLNTSHRQKFKAAAHHAICPLCVGETDEAAWLKTWRLITSTQCPIHDVYLLEHCTGCSMPFHIHTGRDIPLDRCEHCYLHIPSMPVELCSDVDRAPAFALNVGKNNPSCLPVAQKAEHHWWLGIRKILDLIEDPNRALALAQIRLPLEFQELLLEISQNDKRSFATWPLKRRHRALRLMDWLTTDWPARYIDFLKIWGLKSCRPSCLNSHLPDWLFRARNMAYEHAKGKVPRGQPLLAPQFAYLSIPVSQPREKLLNARKGKDACQRWAPLYTTQAVHTLDRRLLAMQGLVSSRVRFLRGVLTLVLEQGASELLISPLNPCSDPLMNTARQTIQKWSDCLQHWHQLGDARVKKVLKNPRADLNKLCITRMLEPQSSAMQLPLFAWTTPSGGDQDETV